MLKTLFAVIAIFSWLTVSSQSQKIDTTGELPAVVIRSIPIIDTLQRIPASVNVISSSDLQRGDPLSFAYEINKLPGIQMQQGALNTSRLVIRGVGARSPFSTNRVKAYLEGIPLTTGEGETTLEDIDLNLIERIEIIKGPASSSYGAGLGGALNLSIRKPGPDENSATIYGNLGSYGLVRGGIATALTSQRSKSLISFNHMEKNGFRQNSHYNRNTLTGFSQYQLALDKTLSFFGNYTHLKAFIPSSLNAEDFRDAPEKAAFTWGQAKGFESYDKLLAGISFDWELSGKTSWQTSVLTNLRDGYEPRPFDILDEKSWAMGIRSVYRTEFTVLNIPSKASAGVEYYDENYTASLFENLYEDNFGNGSLEGEQFNEQEQNRKYLNLFLQISAVLSKKLKTEIGLSYNHSRYRLNDKENPEAVDRSGVYTYPRQFLPNFGITYELLPKKFIYASISQGFSIPTVAETLSPEGAFNPDIKPETGTNYELGIKANWLNKKLYTELALYSLQVNDLLVAERVDQDRFVGRNAGETDHKGLEFLFNFNQYLGKDFLLKPYGSLSINAYSFDEFTDDGTNYNGNELTGVPRHTYNIGLDFAWRNQIRMNLNYLRTGEIPLNDANTVYSDPYGLLNLRLDHKIHSIDRLPITIYGGLNNVLNTDYASQILPNAVGFGGSAPRYFYPGEPVNFYLGLQLNLVN
ncbi:MAG: TonB-dependent receptor [Leeuwenhoekiella sp.]